MGSNEGLRSNLSSDSSDRCNFSTITTGERGDLNGWVCTPKDRPVRAGVVVVHGLGEHADRYRELATRIAELQIATLAFDQQGHGDSPGKRGSPRSYDSMLRDIAHAVDTLSKVTPEVPTVLLGHSMGGNLAANYALRWEHKLKGLILSAPMLLPKNPPKRDQIFAAWLTGKILPFIRISSPVNPRQLTHDEKEVEKAKNDDRMHAKISLRLGTQLLSKGRYTLDHARELTMPVLVLHGDEDHTTDTAASHAFSLKVGDTSTYLNFEGMYHDLLHELEREKVFKAIDDWLEKLLST